jgi:two-component system, chemotaxis family, protein-glutamate methylesterase/glutaminase
VLVCDDSPLFRRVIGDLLRGGGLDVAGEAVDGRDLLEKVATLGPDVVTLDVEMPRMDGLAALGELMRVHPVPVVMVSTLTGAGARATVRALAAGAVDAVQKPPLRVAPGSWDATRDELVGKVLAASRARVGRMATLGPLARPAPGLAARAARVGAPLVVIACSTGGPRALAELLPQLPSPLGAGTLIVQHMPPGVTGSLAERLDAASPLGVREAAAVDDIRPDTALLAPGGSHLDVVGPGRVRRSSAPPVGNLRPRADVTLAGAARHYGPRVLAVVLTGMGNDGEAGVRAVKGAGGRAIVEAERTCVVYGMPRAVARAGMADAEVPLDAMALTITEALAAARRP